MEKPGIYYSQYDGKFPLITTDMQNKMEYRIVRQVLGYPNHVPISESDYHEIATAKDGLVEALYLEEKFDIVLEDFYEYEMELLRLSTRQMLFRDFSYGKFQNEINSVNRRIINLLSACRLYIDHSSHHLSNIFNGGEEKKAEVKSNTSHEYDTVLGYRVMEALRNYVQHRGFPVQRCTYNTKRVEDEVKNKVLFSLTPYLDVEKLKEDGKFKKVVLEELEKIGEKHDIKPLLREYVSSISSIHGKNRALLAGLISQWESTLNRHIETFKLETGDDSIVGLAAVISGENGTYNSPVSIFLELVEHRRELERKNVNLKSLASHYVTSEVV